MVELFLLYSTLYWFLIMNVAKKRDILLGLVIVSLQIAATKLFLGTLKYLQQPIKHTGPRVLQYFLRGHCPVSLQYKRLSVFIWMLLEKSVFVCKTNPSDNINFLSSYTVTKD